jgi:hypothetical protein
MQRKDKLAQALLNHKVQTIQSGDGNVIMGTDLEEIIEDLKYRLCVSDSNFADLFRLDWGSRRLGYTPNQHRFISLKLSARYFLNKDYKLFYLDFIEPWIFFIR